MDNIIIQTQELSFNEMIHYQDIEIKQDQANFIVGKSGIGKSTLLRLFNGTLSPSSGRIFYHGKDVSEMDTIDLRKEILLISQSVYLFDKSIRENFLEFYEYREINVPTESEMAYFLNLCCISFSLDKDCSTMSGGEKHRVYMAIFLSFMPEVIMLDEPTSALDEGNSYSVIKNILLFCKEKGITNIIISHDNKLTELFGENIITIERRRE